MTTMTLVSALATIATVALAGCSQTAAQPEAQPDGDPASHAAAQPDHHHGDQAASSHDHAATATPDAGYHCPMHTEIRSDKPGKCSKCGMNLVADET